LVYIHFNVVDNRTDTSLQTLDLETGEVTTIFRSPLGGWIYYATVSPDGRQLVISYVPPPQSGSVPNQALYGLQFDGSSPPQLLITPQTEFDQYLQVEWSPDGKYIYYVLYDYHNQPEGQSYPNYDIYRMAHPDGQPEKILEHAFWPRVSHDSSRLVYVTLDPITGENKLFTANADGTQAQEVKLSGSSILSIKDAPVFLPDGESLLFSAPAPPQAYQPNWLEKLMGIQIAKAHSIPSDWWSVPVTGGEPIRLTQLNTVGLFASISPDRKHIASLSGEGIFVMDLDGSQLTRLLLDPGVFGTVSWIP
jgi:Tol biopolymer transport system component